jgi:hypothetical protein
MSSPFHTTTTFPTLPFKCTSNCIDGSSVASAAGTGMEAMQMLDLDHVRREVKIVMLETMARGCEYNDGLFH